MHYPITLTPGRRAGRDFAAQIAMLPSTRTAEIAVEDAAGLPIVGAAVQLGAQSARTNAAGMATFATRPGRYPLTVAATGYTTQTSTETVA